MHSVIRVKGNLVKISPQVAMELHSKLIGKPVYSHHEDNDHVFCSCELKPGDLIEDQNKEKSKFHGSLHKKHNNWVFFWRDMAATLGWGWMRRAEAWRNDNESETYRSKVL